MLFSRFLTLRPSQLGACRCFRHTVPSLYEFTSRRSRESGVQAVEPNKNRQHKRANCGCALAVAKSSFHIEIKVFLTKSET